VGQPAPVTTKVGVFIGGESTPRPVKLELGSTYEFRVVLRARRPGHWRTHVQLSGETGGPIPGPSQYIDIVGKMADFTDLIKILDGTTVDIETYGLGEIYLWHLLWAVAAVAWCFYWFRKRGLLGRFVAAASGKAEEITPRERLVGAVTLATILGVVIIFYATTVSNYPNTIPLQGGNDTEPIAEAPSPIKIMYLGGTYKVPGRELVANFKITNEAKEAVRIGEFSTTGLRFLNPDVYTTRVDYPNYLVVERGLSLSDNSPIQPGETKEIAVTVQDARWDAERLSSLAYDVDSSFAGLLFFNTPSGTRYPVEIGGPANPKFLEPMRYRGK
jgi:methane/ammonia monooxygenase subunit B